MLNAVFDFVVARWAYVRRVAVDALLDTAQHTFRVFPFRRQTRHARDNSTRTTFHAISAAIVATSKAARQPRKPKVTPPKRGKVKSSNDKGETRDTYHHGDLRRALLDATLKLIEERGPHGFTLRAAAREAGVTAGATYHHFEDKDALLAGVAEEGFEDFQRVLGAAAKQPAASARERSRNVGVAYVMFAVEKPTRFRTMVGFGVQSRMQHGHLASTAMATYAAVRDVVVEGLRRTPDEAISASEVLGWWSMAHGLAFLAIEGHLGPLGSSASRIAKVVRGVLDAMDIRERSASPAR